MFVTRPISTLVTGSLKLPKWHQYISLKHLSKIRVKQFHHGNLSSPSNTALVQARVICCVVTGRPQVRFHGYRYTELSLTLYPDLFKGALPRNLTRIEYSLMSFCETMSTLCSIRGHVLSHPPALLCTIFGHDTSVF